ncbi:MAG: SAF domain-containing protein [Dermatophilaceae bacterium]
MTALAAPIAGRLRRPSWKDARLVVGLVLVLLATGLGAAGLRAADRRVPVVVAKTTLVPGQRLDPSMLTTVEVQVERTGEAYVAADHGLPSTGYILREVRPGELVPKSALGTAAQVDVAPLAVSIDAVSATTLVSGSLVDVYADKPTTDSGATRFAGPQRVLERVYVAKVSTGGSGLGSTSHAFAQLLIPTGKVAETIGLVNAGAKVTLVAVPGALQADRS